MELPLAPEIAKLASKINFFPNHLAIKHKKSFLNQGKINLIQKYNHIIGYITQILYVRLNYQPTTHQPPSPPQFLATVCLTQYNH
jgi:hypothetical protein